LNFRRIFKQNAAVHVYIQFYYIVNIKQAQSGSQICEYPKTRPFT